MPSREPFDITHSKTVAPITCVDCGHNMHCIRRAPAHPGEHQWFECSACGGKVEKIVGLQPSDAAIQGSMEKSLGISPKSDA